MRLAIYSFKYASASTFGKSAVLTSVFRHLRKVLQRLLARVLAGERRRIHRYVDMDKIIGASASGCKIVLSNGNIVTFYFSFKIAEFKWDYG